ncbi:hypothetical protein GYMLUDRAFT_48943 [Collybiopsis luxurians FD-317 M1]|uniref:Cytochrome c oxidase assembly factor 3 n=1 Tax=Collybiopsis luxurians FD-317 M1 TaxID=944289 RepID=A0A0D0CGQ7_9AGAR|nr:hypothetical protein GYMLUDRAFT_48943 [Collybiopsis luxurians FD-317 M1]
MHPFPHIRPGHSLTRQNTFRNLALGFTGAMCVAAFALYESKKYVEGRRRADLEIYDAVVAQQRLANGEKNRSE